MQSTMERITDEDQSPSFRGAQEIITRNNKWPRKVTGTILESILRANNKKMMDNI